MNEDYDEYDAAVAALPPQFRPLNCGSPFYLRPGSPGAVRTVISVGRCDLPGTFEWWVASGDVPVEGVLRRVYLCAQDGVWAQTP